MTAAEALAALADGEDYLHEVAINDLLREAGFAPRSPSTHSYDAGDAFEAVTPKYRLVGKTEAFMVIPRPVVRSSPRPAVTRQLVTPPKPVKRLRGKSKIVYPKPVRRVVGKSTPEPLGTRRVQNDMFTTPLTQRRQPQPYSMVFFE